eukprot:GHVS01017296.1.p1 GENE.GHVS01017296.1~~GHVS01017296.1.p1  ORF type:complete len:409 (+),score=45.49 GHVS01017296.1:307-1533(+)
MHMLVRLLRGVMHINNPGSKTPTMHMLVAASMVLCASAEMMKLSQYAAPLLLGLVVVAAGGALGDILFGAGKIVTREDCSDEYPYKLSLHEKLDDVTSMINKGSLQTVHAVVSGNQAALLDDKKKVLHVCLNGEAPHEKVMEFLRGNRKYELIKLDGLESLAGMTGSNICFKSDQDKFQALTDLVGKKPKDQGAVNKYFIMAGKTLDLVKEADASLGRKTVLNFEVPQDETWTMSNENVATWTLSVRFTVEDHKRLDTWTASRGEGVDLEKDDLEKIVKAVGADSLVIGKGISCAEAIVLVDMDKVVAMYQETFLNLYKDDDETSRTFFGKGNFMATEKLSRVDLSDGDYSDQSSDESIALSHDSLDSEDGISNPQIDPTTTVGDRPDNPIPSKSPDSDSSCLSNGGD